MDIDKSLLELITREVSRFDQLESLEIFQPHATNAPDDTADLFIEKVADLFQSTFYQIASAVERLSNLDKTQKLPEIDKDLIFIVGDMLL